jgi:uncharacterized protein DUF4032
MLEHRWFLSERAGAEISMEEAAKAYVNTVLSGLPDEEVAVSDMESTGPLSIPVDRADGLADEEFEKPYDPWEDEAANSEEQEQAPAYLDIAALRAKARK